MESLLVITTTEAGSGDESRVRQAVDVLRSGADVQVSRTSLPGDLDGILHRRGGRTVVVAGGDGSLHTVVSALHRRMELDDTVIALLPLGTANDFARDIDIPLDPAAAARVVLSGVERRYNLLVDCQGNVVVHRVRVVAGKQSSAPSWRPRRHTLRLRVEAETDGTKAVLADFDQPLSWIQVRNLTTGSDALEEATTAAGAEVRLAFAPHPFAGLSGMVSRRLRQPQHTDLTTTSAERLHVAGQRFYLQTDGDVDGPEQNRMWMVSPRRLRLITPA